MTRNAPGLLYRLQFVDQYGDNFLPINSIFSLINKISKVLCAIKNETRGKVQIGRKLMLLYACWLRERRLGVIPATVGSAPLRLAINFGPLLFEFA